jgi:uncharacterized membrane protein
MIFFRQTVLLLLLLFFTILMVNITLPYFALEDTTAFLKIKQWIIHNRLWKSAFYVHVFTSSFCLLAGFTQFSEHWLKHYPLLHRSMGIGYVVVILFLAGPSGLIMSVYANGGPLSQLAFILLSVLWILFTYLGYHYARKGDIGRHRQFMIRSFALTLSALTLRAWKFGIVLFFRPQPMDLYMLVAWLGWIPNLLFAEWYIRKWYSRYKLTLK